MVGSDWPSRNHVSEAGPNHCGPEVEPDPPATTGGIPGCQSQFFLVPPTRICGFLFSLSPSTCCYLLLQLRKDDELVGASRRVKTVEEGEDSEGRNGVWRAAKETIRLCVIIIVYKASQSSSLCSSIKTLRDEEGVQGRDYIPLNMGDGHRGGEVPACTHCLDYEEETGKDPDFLAASSSLPPPSSPACQSISQRGSVRVTKAQTTAP